MDQDFVCVFKLTADILSGHEKHQILTLCSEFLPGFQFFTRHKNSIDVSLSQRFSQHGLDKKLIKALKGISFATMWLVSAPVVGYPFIYASKRNFPIVHR